MRPDLRFSQRLLDSVLGGVSVIDLRQLHISTIEKAYDFAKIYGYDLNDAEDREAAWSYHRKAVTFLREFLLEEGEDLPEILTDPQQLKDPAFLLIYASTQEHQNNSIQKWACAILRVVHVYVHLENDLFRHYRDEIQQQILRPIEERITQRPVMGSPVLGLAADGEQITLNKFEVKTMKTTSSAIIKLLAKPAMVTQSLYDRLGVRFVTRNIFDSFRVLRYLIHQHLVSVAHIMPDQSNNTLYPTNLFLEVMGHLQTSNEGLSEEQIQQQLLAKLEMNPDAAKFREKYNPYSGEAFRNMKFISRRLISVAADDGQKKNFRFFYPFEVQIIDHDAYVSSLSGPSAHAQYKERQRRAARARVLGLTLKEGGLWTNGKTGA